MEYACSTTECCPQPVGFSCQIDCVDWPIIDRSPGFARPVYNSGTIAAPLIPNPCCRRDCEPNDFPTFDNNPLCCKRNTCEEDDSSDNVIFGFLGVGALMALLICGNLDGVGDLFCNLINPRNEDRGSGVDVGDSQPSREAYSSCTESDTIPDAKNTTVEP